MNFISIPFIDIYMKSIYTYIYICTFMKYIKDSYSSRLLNSPEINVDSTWLRRNRGFPGSSEVKNLSAMQEPREM